MLGVCPLLSCQDASSATANCPDGWVAVGLEGNVGFWIDSIALRCKKLEIDGTLSGLSITAELAAVGSGTAQAPKNCGTGQILVGSDTGTGLWIDRIVGYCQTPSGIGDLLPPLEALAEPFGLPNESVVPQPCPAGYAVTGISTHYIPSPSELSWRCTRLVKE